MKKIILIMAFVLCLPKIAFSLSCLPYVFEKMIYRTPIIFSAKIIDIGDLPSSGYSQDNSAKIKFVVDKVYKGDLGGKDYLVFTSGWSNIFDLKLICVYYNFVWWFYTLYQSNSICLFSYFRLLAGVHVVGFQRSIVSTKILYHYAELGYFSDVFFCKMKVPDIKNAQYGDE